MSALKTHGSSMKAPPVKDSTFTYGAEESSYKGAGWVVFAAMMFVLAGCLSIIWGIAAVSSSHFFVANATYILSDLNTWGWIVMCFGVVEFIAAASIWRGGESDAGSGLSSAASPRSWRC